MSEEMAVCLGGGVSLKDLQTIYDNEDAANIAEALLVAQYNHVGL